VSRLVVVRGHADLAALGSVDGDVRVSIGTGPAGLLPEGARSMAGYVEGGYSDTDRTAVRWLKDLSHADLDDGGTLCQALASGDTSLWWFMEGEVYRRVFKDTSRLVVGLRAAIAAERPTALALVDDGTALAHVAIATAAAAGIPSEAIPGRAPPRPRALTSGRFGLFGRALRDRLRRWAAPSNGPALPEGRQRVLVASMSREQVSVDPDTKERATEDLVLASVLSALAAKTPVLGTLGVEVPAVTQLYKFPYGQRIRVPRNQAGAGPVRPWEAYRDGAARAEIRREVSRLEELRRRLWASPAFAAAWTYEGVPLWNALAPSLAEVWRRNSALGARYLTLARRVLEAERPDVVLMASETSIDNKAIVVEANRRGVSVVAVQHGTIVAADDYLVDYSHSPADMEGVPSKEGLYAGTVCLFGDEVLSVMADDIGYAFPERLHITGQPRFDGLVAPVDDVGRARFCTAFDLDHTQRLLLIGSQTFNIAGDKDQFFEAVLGALGQEKHLQIVVKPHPIEPARYHMRMARRLGVHVTVLPPNFDMQQAIRACDALLTSYSTVALEAMLAGKPVVTVNLTGQPDLVPYAREGAALGATSVDEIALAVRLALDGGLAREALLAAAKAYVQREIAQCDGHATERVIDAVMAAAQKRSSAPDGERATGW